MMAGALRSLFHGNNLRSLFHGNNLLTHRSSTISYTRQAITHSRCGVSRQVSFTRACDAAGAGVAAKDVTLSLKKSPWLTLPSKDPMVNRFYSLEENRVIPVIKQYTTSDRENGMDIDDDALCLGSSQGWLVYTNRSDCALFLYNPISNRIIKLPSIYTLRDDKPYYPYGFINTLILTSSPNEQGCLAVCIYGPLYRLAFCRLGDDTTATTWIPLNEFNTNTKTTTMGYLRIAYSSKDKLLYGLTHSRELIRWDLRDPSSPKLMNPIEDFWDWGYDADRPWLGSDYSDRVPYFIAEPWSDELIVIERFVDKEDQTNNGKAKAAYKTIGFEVLKVDFKDKVPKYVEGSLDDRVFFAGRQSFSLPAQEFSQHVRPNSIYFNHYSIGRTWLELEGGPPEMGIFNFQEKVFEPCNYACHFEARKPITSAPVWFIPDPTS